MRGGSILPLILLLSLLTASIPSVAQRRIDKEISKDWYRLAVKPIRIAPPDGPEMPASVRNAYHTFDSLGHLTTLGDWEGIRRWAANLHHRELFRYLKDIYLMDDFDPLLYDEYRGYAVDVDTGYRTTIAVLEQDLLHEGTAKLQKLPANYLLHADELLHVRIVGIQHDPNIPYNPILYIDAEVLDGLKGSKFYRSLKEPKKDSLYPIVQFSVTEGANRTYKGNLDGYETYCGNGLGRTVGPSYGDLHLAEGMEAIIFLENMILDYDGTSAWYDMHPIPYFDTQGGIYLVKDGRVSNLLGYWGKQKELGVSEFKKLIRKGIANFLNE
ncbi:MAG: hypothetical protein ACHQNE_01075 [Candidatus Kapaibacterium sp.]